MSKRLPLLGVVFLILGLVVGVYYVNQKRGFELRKKAAETKGSQILLKGPSRVNVGEKFSVGVILDTTTDSQYTISGVDAVVSYGLQGIEGSGKTSSVPLAGSVVVKPETNPTGISAEEIRRREQELQDTKLSSSTGRPEFLPIRAISLLSITPGKIFDSYPTQTPACVPLPPCADGTTNERGGNLICAVSDKPPGGGEWCPRTSEINDVSLVPPRQTKFLNPVIISGVKNYSVNDKGYFNGFTGQGVFATLTFVATQPGKAAINLAYKGPSATDDTNVNGFLARQPVSLQKPQERLLTAPQTFTVDVAASQPSLTPTSRPVPSLQVIFPNGGENLYVGQSSVPLRWNFTPPRGVNFTYPLKTSIYVISYTQGIRNFVYTIADQYANTKVGENTYVWSIPRIQQGKYRIYVSIVNPAANVGILAEDESDVEFNLLGERTTPTPKPSCTPLPPCAYEGVPDPNDSSKRVFCVVDLLPGAWSCPRPTPTPTPPPVGKLSFTLSDTNGNPVRQVVKIFAVPAPTNVRGATVYAAGFSELIVSNTPSPNTPPPPNRNSHVLLGETQTNASGAGDIWIKNEYLSKPWALYAQTPSHLIRYMQVNIYPVWFSPGKTVDVKFDNLIPGDIYVASGQNRQDGVINNFDVADLFRQWGPYAQIQINSPKPPVPADLNADGTVNNRDLAVLLSNFGKKGDLQQATSTGKEGNFTGVLKPAGPSIYMWGTHTLEVDDGTVYRVRTISGAKELLTRYEGQRVIVYGTLEYLQLEGGFWSLTAEGVVVDEGPGFGPNPAQ